MNKIITLLITTMILLLVSCGEEHRTGSVDSPTDAELKNIAQETLSNQENQEKLRILEEKEKAEAEAKAKAEAEIKAKEAKLEAERKSFVSQVRKAKQTLSLWNNFDQANDIFLSTEGDSLVFVQCSTSDCVTRYNNNIKNMEQLIGSTVDKELIEIQKTLLEHCKKMKVINENFDNKIKNLRRKSFDYPDYKVVKDMVQYRNENLVGRFNAIYKRINSDDIKYRNMSTPEIEKMKRESVAGTTREKLFKYFFERHIWEEIENAKGQKIVRFDGYSKIPISFYDDNLEKLDVGKGNCFIIEWVVSQDFRFTAKKIIINHYWTTTNPVTIVGILDAIEKAE